MYVYPISCKLPCRPNLVVPPHLLPCGSSCCCFCYCCPSPVSMNQARRDMNSCQSDLNQSWENKLGVPLKKKKIHAAFWVFVGTLRTCFQALLFCPKGWKAALNTRKQSLPLPLPKKKKKGSKLKRLWTLCSRLCGSKEKSLQPSQDLATPGPCQQSALPHYCKSQAEPSLLWNIQ